MDARSNNQNEMDAKVENRSPTSLLVILFVLVTGLALTAAMYVHFISADNARINERLLRGTQTLATISSFTSPDPTFSQADRVLSTLQQDISDSPGLTQERLDSYLWIPDPPSEESINIRYMPKVSYNNSEQKFEMIDTFSQIRDFQIPILDAALEGPKMATKRDEYYPIMLEANNGINPGVIGLNHFYAPSVHIAMDQARDSGNLVSRTSFPQLDMEETYIIASYYLPLYASGTNPVTIAERREHHIGFISATSFTPANLMSFLPESYQGVNAVFFSETEAFSSDNQDPELKAIIASGEFAFESFDTNGTTTYIITRPSFSLSQKMKTPNRWWAMSLGLILSAWICSMLLWSRSQSLKMSELVRVRTQDLGERTTKLHEANNALSTSEALYRMLADNASDVICTYDIHGTCTYISPSITQQTGFDVEDYIGSPIYSHLPPDSKEIIKAQLNMAKSDPESIPVNKTYEIEIYCKNGDLKIVECTTSLLPIEEGSEISFLSVSRDITERKKAEQEKESLKQAFQQSQKMEAIGTLAGGIAHDFNNLLTVILGHTELIKAESRSPLAPDHSLNIIETAALRAKELTSQLLGFARKGRFQAKPVDINSAVQEATSLIERTIDKNIKISLKICDSEPVITGDPGQISQVLINLAVNARDAMPEGGEMTFETRIEDVDAHFCETHVDLAPGKYCVISILDTGMGVSKDKINHIFEPFFSDKGEGTGLGLAMVYGVTRNHGGIVTVESEKGRGAIFNVYLPLSESTIEKNSDPHPKAEPVPGTGTILVVDDEEQVRNLVEKMLLNLGYSVVLAEDGVEALKYYQKHWQDIDTVIMDLIMPNMGGLQCLEKMSEIQPKLKAIIATGYSPDSVNQQANKEYVIGFLQKPFMQQELSELLASTLPSLNN